MKKQDRYSLRGVSASKDEVHSAIKGLDYGLFQNSFCKVLPDFVGGSDDFCNIMHADTAGTKTSLAYIYWKETGDLSVWKGIVQDALVMNLDDMGCVGAYTDVIVSSTIGRNKRLISGEVIKVIIQYANEFVEKMKKFGINLHLAGGETADVGDIVRSIDVGYTTFARMPRKNLIVNSIVPGNVIIGFSSFGKSIYEDNYNSGIGSNGLTSARHDLFSHKYYGKYPESYNPGTKEEYLYSGKSDLLDKVSIDGELITLGKLALSPTRTYLPLLKILIEKFHNEIDGIIHNTGGGQTKVKRFIGNVKVVKNNLFEIPFIFNKILKETETDLKEMYQVFNMGSRLEIYTSSTVANEIIEIARDLGIEARIIGFVEASDKPMIEIITDNHIIEY